LENFEEKIRENDGKLDWRKIGKLLKIESGMLNI